MFTAWVEELLTSLRKRPPPSPEPSPENNPAGEIASAPTAIHIPGSADESGRLDVEDCQTPEGGDDQEAEEAIIDWPVASPEEIAAARIRAEADAVARPHRIFPSTPAGPGSLSEALRRLEEAGRVVSAYVDDGTCEPYLAYHPV